MSGEHRLTAAIAVAANGIAVLGPPLVTVLTVDAETYGFFSLVYIVYSLGSTLVVSVVSDAAARSSESSRILRSKRSYIPPVTHISLIVGVVALVLCLAVPELRSSAIPAPLAIGASTYRLGARYQEVYTGRYPVALRADLAMAIGLLVGWPLFSILLGGPSALVAFSSWAFAGFSSLLLGTKPEFGTRACLPNWYSARKREIRPLLGEAMFTEVTAVLGPLVLIPMLDVAKFGVYRATFNVAAPMRAMFSAIRPTIAARRLEELASRRVFAVLAIACAMSGGGAYVALRLIGMLGWFGGAIQELAVHALPVSLYVTSSVFYTFWYLVARKHASTRNLLMARVCQSFLLVACPAFGAWIFALEGAIWGVFSAMLTSGIVWLAATLWRQAK